MKLASVQASQRHAAPLSAAVLALCISLLVTRVRRKGARAAHETGGRNARQGIPPLQAAPPASLQPAPCLCLLHSNTPTAFCCAQAAALSWQPVTGLPAAQVRGLSVLPGGAGISAFWVQDPSADVGAYDAEYTTVNGGR